MRRCDERVLYQLVFYRSIFAGGLLRHLFDVFVRLYEPVEVLRATLSLQGFLIQVKLPELAHFELRILKIHSPYLLVRLINF